MLPLSPEAIPAARKDEDDKTQQRRGVAFDAPVDENAGAKAAKARELDLVHHIDGMYRLLDLISEQGSGGLGASDFYSPVRTLVYMHFLQSTRSSSLKSMSADSLTRFLLEHIAT